MATPVLITHENYSTHLVQSTQGRAGTPDGNIFFDMVNNRIEIITAEELAMVDLGSGAEANPLTNNLGITLQGLYNFENQERRTDETLRTFLRATKGTYRFAGAFAFWDSNKLYAGANSTTNNDDRFKIRGSGWIEYSDSGSTVDRIYHGIRSLVDIQAGTQPYTTLVTDTLEATLQAATWTNTFRTGDIDEAVQVFGTTANGDTGAGDFDYTTRKLVVRPRSWQYTPQETTSEAAGITEFSGFSGGYGAGETINTANTYTLADVYGGAQIAPWTGMSLEKVTPAQTETGFNEADGDFTWVLQNTLGGTVQECAAYLDALTLQNSDIDSGAGSYNGKNGRVWYRRESGKVVTNSIDDAGLFIEGLSTAEQQGVIFTDDAAAQKTYPFFPSIVITVGAAALADANAWYHVFYADGASNLDFDTTNAVTVNDSAGNPVKGNIQTDQIGGKITFAFAYDTNVQAGLSAGTDKEMIVIIEGDGGAGQALTPFTVTRSTTIPVTCAPETDNNA